MGKQKGLTLVESLVSITMVSVLVVSILGAFFISRISTARAKHRLAAMKIIRQQIEQEVMHHTFTNWADSYVTDVGDVTIDDRGTADAADDLMGAIAYYPAPPFEEEDAGGNPWRFPEGGLRYKVFGFQVTWQEDGTGGNCNERASVYVAEHPQV